MNELQAILEQGRQLVIQSVPAEVLQSAVPIALVSLAAGVGLSVLGAKLARGGVTLAFILLGGGVGLYFAQQIGYAPAICGLAGAGLIGLIGYHTYRFWVGLMTALVLTAAVLGVLGYEKVGPHVIEFARESGGLTEGLRPGGLPMAALADHQAGSASTVSVSSSSASLEARPTQDRTQSSQAPSVQRSAAEWLHNLWAFIVQQDVEIERQGKAVALGAMVIGLCLGVIASRWAMILTTSMVGTLLVTTGVTALLTRAIPGSYHSLQQHPSLIGMGVGGLLVASLFIQTMLTRPVGKAKSTSTKS